MPWKSEDTTDNVYLYNGWWCVSSRTASALVLTLAYSNPVSFGGEIIHYMVRMYHLTTVYLIIIFIYSPIEPLFGRCSPAVKGR